jgi:indolepyruvate ferredoxin oxidoreductase alpha subunit
MKRSIIGNQAVAYGALAAGIDVAAGYPGTPSSEALNELLHFSRSAARGNDPSPYVEWSVNEKVAFELATGAAWAGKRALATMKMSGANVAADSILSVAYSGTKGGLVLYIADDPGAEAGMPEQDTRLFAQWAGLPVLEPADPARAYQLTRYAFELSERCELPVILRSVTSVAHAKQEVEGEYAYKPLKRKAAFQKNILRYTKAGAVICMDQHRDLLERLKVAEISAAEAGINRLHEADDGAGLFVVAAGALIPYVREALSAGDHRRLSTLFLESVYPLDTELAGGMFGAADRILVLEELEPFVEMQLRSEASRLGWNGTILGKLDGLFPRVGKYSQEIIGRGLTLLAEGRKGGAGARASATGVGRTGGQPAVDPTAAQAAAADTQPAASTQPATPLNVKHPITFCAGCPHRGSFMAINRALKKIGLDRDNTVVTGDIGCTILGMNPPFHTCWTEVSMGSSIGLAQGFYRAGIENPLIATIGDSTFFHAGIPPLVNAIQHGTNLLVIILDNGWTSMTGFQVNPGTAERFQARGDRRVEIEGIVRGMGVENLQVIGPFDQEQSVEAIVNALQQEGVKVIISQAECALTAARREERTQIYRIDSEKCTFCRSCLRETGCPALYVTANGGKSKHGQVMAIDPELCTGCGLCFTCCKFDAISRQKLGGSST